MASPPPPAPRTLARWTFVAAFLTMQIVAPATYYLSDAREDERFAWRMFSTTRMTACEPEGWEDLPDDARRPITLEAQVHGAWITHISHNRRRIIADFLDGRCEGDVVRAGLDNACTTPDDREVRWRWIHDCERGELTREALP